MVVAFLALLAALAGTAAALPGKNTVRSKDIKNGQVKSADIRNNNVKSADVRNGSLQSKDFGAGQLPEGDKGDKGQKGDRGDKGEKGDQGSAGSAVAYALIDSGGTVISEESRNITQANVDPDTVAGTVCFTGLPFTPRNVMVSADGIESGGQKDVIASSSVSVGGTIVTLDCQGKVHVNTFDVSSGALADRAFHVWFED